MADRDFSLTDSDDPNNPQEKEIVSKVFITLKL